MAIDRSALLSREFPDVVQTYTARDCILYALGVGVGADPTDAAQLRFVYEAQLQMLPTMPVVLGSPGFWVKNADSGIDWKAVLHGEQGLTIHRPLPAQGTLIGRTRIDEIIDKGPGKGALMYSHRDILDAQSGQLLATCTSTTFCRNDGGFGGPSGPTRAPHPMPERAPDQVFDRPTLAQAALIYRLSGDDNPLHADPQVAHTAGFRQPILHGLCTYGVAGYAVLRTLCQDEPERLQRLDVRFTAPVYPGETIRTEIWRDAPGRASFRCRVVERDVVVLNNGLAHYHA
jgi:acyl dehydratase